MRRFYKIDPQLQYEKIEDIIRPPVVVRVTDFDEEDLEDFEEDIDEAHRSGQKVIPIVIDSYGGALYGAMGMIAAVESCRLPVATILTSKAMSAGAMLFMFGTEGYRFMHPHAGMMIHDVSSDVGGKIEEIKSDSRNLDALNKAIYSRASKQIGKESDYLANLIHKNHHVDWFLTAKEAKKHNIANHLKIPSFEIEVSVKVTFR
jgi:ATP-dependent protease ClpP protease subunit